MMGSLPGNQDSELLWYITLVLASVSMVAGIVAMLWPRLLGLRLMKILAVLLILLVCLITLEEVQFAAHQTWGWVLPLVLQLGALLCLGGLYLVLRHRPQARGPAIATAMIIGGATTLSWLLWQLEEPAATPTDRNHRVVTPANDPSLNPATPAALAWTDLGNPIQLYTCTTDASWVRGEAVLLEAEYATRVIRLAPYDQNYNCHGWTFTGGRYHLLGNAVEHILADNCYFEVSDPNPGDVILYWDEHGLLLHTGVVRLTDGHGLVVIESKWDLLGRYLHAPDVQPYSSQFTYYRTDRPTHILAGIKSVTATAP